MYRKKVRSVKLEDLNVGMLGLKRWEELTLDQRRERMEDMMWILDMLFCARVLGGLKLLDWQVAKNMTFPEYMKAVKAQAKVKAS